MNTEAWTAFLEIRKLKGKRAPFTKLAEKRILFELRRLQADGHDPDEVLLQSVINGWSGVFPVKGRPKVIQAAPTIDATDEWLRKEAEHRKAVEADRLRRKAAA
jgi:hypothetical protein